MYDNGCILVTLRLSYSERSLTKYKRKSSPYSLVYEQLVFINCVCPFLFVVDIEVGGSLAEPDPSHTEELSLTILVLGCLCRHILIYT